MIDKDDIARGVPNSAHETIQRIRARGVVNFEFDDNTKIVAEETYRQGWMDSHDAMIRVLDGILPPDQLQVLRLLRSRK